MPCCQKLIYLLPALGVAGVVVIAEHYSMRLHGTSPPKTPANVSGNKRISNLQSQDIRTRPTQHNLQSARRPPGGY